MTNLSKNSENDEIEQILLSMAPPPTDAAIRERYSYILENLDPTSPTEQTVSTTEIARFSIGIRRKSRDLALKVGKWAKELGEEIASPGLTPAYAGVRGSETKEQPPPPPRELLLESATAKLHLRITQNEDGIQISCRFQDREGESILPFWIQLEDEKGTLLLPEQKVERIARIKGLENGRYHLQARSERSRELLTAEFEIQNGDI